MRTFARWLETQATIVRAAARFGRPAPAVTELAPGEATFSYLRGSPLRMIVASAADIVRSAATAASALDSWMKPIVAFSRTTARMAMAS